MQMQPQSKPQSAQQNPNPMQATVGALQKAKATSSQPEQPNQQGGGQDDFSSEITENLEQHLNNLDPRQQRFLADSLQHYANIVIPVLGIVCGPEVFQYFVQLYQQTFAKGQQQPGQQQPNSAPTPQGQGPNSSPNPQQGVQQPQPATAQDQPAQATQQLPQ